MHKLGRRYLHLWLQAVISGLLMLGGYSASILWKKILLCFHFLFLSHCCPERVFYHSKILGQSLCRNAVPDQHPVLLCVLRFLECPVTLPGNIQGQFAIQVVHYRFMI